MAGTGTFVPREGRRKVTSIATNISSIKLETILGNAVRNITLGYEDVGTSIQTIRSQISSSR